MDVFKADKEASKAKEFLNQTVNNLDELFDEDQDDQKKPIIEEFQTYTFEECQHLKNIDGEEDEYVQDEILGNINDRVNDLVVEHNVSNSKVKLYRNQDYEVKKLSSWSKAGQMLVFLQGVPGAGKTTAAKTFQ